MNRLITTLAVSIFLSGIVATFAHDVSDAAVVSVRDLAESASASASPSLSVTYEEGSPAALIAGALAAFGLVFDLLDGLVLLLPALAGLIAILMGIFAAIMAFFVIVFGREALPEDRRERNRNLQLDGETVDALEDVIELLQGIVDDLVLAREDPLIGTGLDGEICEIVEVIDYLEILLPGTAGKRRVLKAKSGGADDGLDFCVESGSSGKSASAYSYSGKTYSPMPTDYSAKSYSEAAAYYVYSPKSKAIAEDIRMEYEGYGKSAKAEKASKGGKASKGDKSAKEGKENGMKSVKGTYIYKAGKV